MYQFMVSKFKEDDMDDHSQHKYLTTELDPEILRTPFKVQTNWHIITGAPSSGKTVTIELLTEKGFKTHEEGARQYMEEELAKGVTIEEIRGDAIALQRSIFDNQLKIESLLIPEEFIFLDRGSPDSLSFSRVFGLDPNEFLPRCFHFRYASVFMLDPLPYQTDGLRFEDETLPIFLDEWHVRDYNALGYDVVRVPVLSVEERVTFILENLSE
jgi:predicted ATPase